MLESEKWFVFFIYLLLAGLSGYSIYSIYKDFVKDNQTGNTKKDLEQLSVLISGFYILILITSLLLGILVIRYGTILKSSILIFNSFLFFYGFITFLPAIMVASDGGNSSIYGPIATSVFAMLFGIGFTIYYVIEDKNEKKMIGDPKNKVELRK